ncbi:MAG: hypothetical protein V2A58_17855 [Planctomycetota bacterium]
MSRALKILLAAFCVACVAWFVLFEVTYALDRTLCVDEHQYLAASTLVSLGKLPYRDFAFNQAPLMAFLYGLIFRFSAPGFVFARMLTLGFAMAAVLLLAASLWRGSGSSARRPLSAALLILAATGVPVFVLGVSFIHNAPLGMFFAALAFVLVPEGADASPWRWLAAGICAGLAFATRVLNLPVPVVLFAYALLLPAPRRWRNPLLFALGGLVGVSPLLVSFLMSPAECWACVVSMHGVIAQAAPPAAAGSAFAERVSFFGEYMTKDILFGLNFLFAAALFVLPVARRWRLSPAVPNKDLLAVALAAAFALTVLAIPIRYPHYFAIAVPFELYAGFALLSWAWRRLRERRALEFVLLIPFLFFFAHSEPWTVSFLRANGLFSDRGTRALHEDAQLLRGMLPRGAVVYTTTTCVVIEAGLAFDPKLAGSGVWFNYAASPQADPSMLRILRTPQDVDNLFRSCIPDAGLVASHYDAAFEGQIAKHYFLTEALETARLYLPCRRPDPYRAPPALQAPPEEIARANALKVRSCWTAAEPLVRAWLDRGLDRDTFLFPDVMGETYYRPWLTGANNIPWLALASRIVAPDDWRDLFPRIAKAEETIAVSSTGLSRPVNLRDPLGPYEQVGLPYDSLIFQTSEYMKDALAVYMEALRPEENPWWPHTLRLAQLVMDNAEEHCDLGPIPSARGDMNGDILMVLALLAPATGDPRYYEWGRRISHAYLRHVLPANKGIPCNTWYFKSGHGDGMITLADHGDEIITGLTLFCAVLKDAGEDTAAFERALAAMYDWLLAHAVIDDTGLFHQEMRIVDDYPKLRGANDAWGYVHLGLYDMYLITGKERFRRAVLRTLESLADAGDIGGSSHPDCFADSIESAILLVAREPVPAAFAWIERQFPKLLAFQRPDGTATGDHLDGNWLRTVMLYASMKARGALVSPWRADVAWGACPAPDGLHLWVESQSPWQGRLLFDLPRHRLLLRFSKDYPRLNEITEWFTVEPDALYRVRLSPSEEPLTLPGRDLAAGLPLSVSPDRPVHVVVSPLGLSPSVPRTSLAGP